MLVLPLLGILSISCTVGGPEFHVMSDVDVKHDNENEPTSLMQFFLFILLKKNIVFKI